jgi:hypothetical protein
MRFYVYVFRQVLNASVTFLLLAVSLFLVKQSQATTTAPIIVVASNMHFVIDEQASDFKKKQD